MIELIIVLHTLVAIALIAFVLVQQGKGADMGAAFGSGASQTLFGARGSANFLSRTTAVLATIFFLTSLGLTVMYSRQVEVQSVTEIPAPTAPAVPAAPATPAVPATPAAPAPGIPEIPK
jgi:preprotein translocase subunit SecG